MTTWKRKCRKTIFGIVTVCLVVCLSVAVVELFFRIVYFQPRGRVAVPYEFQVSKIEGVPYELTPDHSYEWRYGARKLFDSGFTIPVQINSSGYRDDEIIEPKPENTYRILALGDSFTWGLGVKEKDSWVEQLEKILNENKADLFQNKDIEVINTGVGSWNTEVEYSYLKEKGMSLDPDAVILGFLVNDFRAGNTNYTVDERGYLATLEEGNKRIHLQSLLYEEESRGNIFTRMIESSHAIRWASGRRVRTEKRKLMVFNDKNSHNKTLKALENIYSETKRAGIPFYVCIFPYVENVIPESEKTDLDIIAQRCESLSIPFARMENAISELDASCLWVHPKDHHPNAKAHNLYAEFIRKQFFHGKNTQMIRKVEKSFN